MPKWMRQKSVHREIRPKKRPGEESKRKERRDVTFQLTEAVKNNWMLFR